MSDCNKINYYKEKMLDFIRKFDDEANRLLDQKRKQFELEGDTLGYVRLDKIREDMLASCVRISPRLNRKNPDFKEADEEFMLYVSSAICFVKEVSSIEWFEIKYSLAYESFLRECIGHVFPYEINVLYYGIRGFLNCVRTLLIKEGLTKIG